ncbi:uncharacterized protein LOC113348381 isoform X9 [Papaver somniferum]|uniref:uncharacterized protein LOC113348381 isoform X9 n=1 Tax=Papaver somniferum TaxID=3469 RepID=UPI000E7016FB|nr:uncharacterized protein LOC113348381 isoform X9 [Papaver somniferum]
MDIYHTATREQSYSESSNIERVTVTCIWSEGFFYWNSKMTHQTNKLQSKKLVEEKVDTVDEGQPKTVSSEVVLANKHLLENLLKKLLKAPGESDFGTRVLDTGYPRAPKVRC